MFFLLGTICQSVLCFTVLLFLCWFSLICLVYQDKQCSLIEIERSDWKRCSQSVSSTIDSRLTLNHLTMVGTHNSYHLSNPFYRYSHPTLDQQFSQGVRQIELDIHLMKDHLLVYHLQLFDHRTTCYCLKECLIQIARWKEKNLCHSPIYLFLEIKQMFYEDLFTGLITGVTCEHFTQIKDQFLQIFDEQMFILPKQIQSNETSLRLSLEKQRMKQLKGDYSLSNSGWPTLEKSLNKILPIFLDDVHQIVPNLYSQCQSLEHFFFIAQSNVNLPYSSIITISNPRKEQKKLLNGAFITRILFPYGKKNLLANYLFAKQHGIHLISSDSLQCNHTLLCRQLNKDFQSSSILCNSYLSPSFCHSSSLNIF